MSGAVWRTAWLVLACLAGRAAGAQTLTECRVPGIANSVWCGAVSRPLDPARPAGTRIDVHFVVVAALARHKWPDPVFLVAGGPGQSAIDLAAQTLPWFARLNNRRDIVYVDQRGTGRSAALQCPDTKAESLAAQSDPERAFQRLMACQAQLLTLPFIHAPADLGLFTTTLAMQDLDAVRAALGAPRINLVGVSYGTRAVLEYLRLFAGASRRAVLDAVTPADMVLPVSASLDSQAALDALFDACDREPRCAHAYPALRAEWAALLRGLPRPARAVNPHSGTPESFTLTREMVLGAVRSALYAPALAAGLPAAITAAAHQRYEPLLGLGAALSSRSGGQLAAGMHFSVVCAEDAPRMDRALQAGGADFGTSFAQLYERVCAHWPRGVVAPEFYTVAPTRTPTLLFSGGIDPATPPRHGARIAAALGASARHVVVPGGGHGALSSACGRELVYKFIDAADDAQALSVDAACARTIPRPGVFIPDGDAPGGAPP